MAYSPLVKSRSAQDVVDPPLGAALAERVGQRHRAVGDAARQAASSVSSM